MLTGVKADGQCAKIKAQQDSVVAQKNADAVRVEGQGEEALKGVLSLRRLYTFLNRKLDVIREMGLNKDLKIFGKSDDGGLSQLAAYQMVNNNARI